MTDANPPPATAPHDRMGWGWRVVFSAAAVVPIAVPVGSLVAAFVAPRNWFLGWCGIPFAAAAVLMAGYNWGLELRWRAHLRKHGSRDGFHYVSGIPVVGNLFAVLGAAVSWGDWRAAFLALVAVVIDAGGFPWFLIAMIRTRQF